MAIAVAVSGATVAQRNRAFAAWGDFLHPGRDATLAEIEAYLRGLVIGVTRDYETKLLHAAVSAPADLDP